MRKWKAAFVCASGALGLIVAVAVHSQQPTSQKSRRSANTGSSQENSITLPQYPAEITPGPNMEVFSKDCLVCHSARYVSMQPRFPKSVWQSEVKKMIDAYGAVIPEGDQPLIVDYLVAVKGIETPAATPTK